jgi:tetratricopeptide (TPR) repeat protein
MGTPYHHYIIADDWIIPPDSEIYFSEKVVRLRCYQPNDRKRVISARPVRADVGLPEDAFVYCCFNGTQKISRFTFDRWMEVLNRVPQSVLWLLETSTESRERLSDYAEAKGIERRRIVFAPKRSNPEHLARYALADLVLDTVPYGAHTTASDALWAGVPVLTLSGRSFASRVCGSLVRSAGLSELVVTRPEDYVERAVALANDSAQIAAYKQKLEESRDRCVLFDTGLLVGRIEELYRWMAREHNAGRTPVPDLANLDAYLEAGIEHPHEDAEMLAVADYHGVYKAKLALRHLARPLQPDNRLWSSGDVALAEARAGIGTLAVLRKLADLRAAPVDPEMLLNAVQPLLPAALRHFNEHLAQGEIGEAEQYVSALLALVPRNSALLNAALSCNLALGRKDEALGHARALLETEPSHALARELVAQSSAPQQVDVEALVRLRDIHDEISAVLCRPLDAPGAKLIELRLAEARGLQIHAETGSEIEGWETHYGVMLDAIDLGAVLGPTPAPLPDADVEIVSSLEQPTSWLELRAAAARMGAQAVFFAAADRDYVDLYAQWYLKSILKHCDVPFLVVVHVIGGAANLAEIARSVGIRDKRVFFAGDDFDASAVTTACFDAPPKGRAQKPLSHLQSMRFLRLGSLLQKLKLPVFVSDIDLLLQFGVKDLLERRAQDDVVLNCNQNNKHAGSRITANLVLANPTENADRFFGFLRNFLERQLAKRGVTRWIDQTALLLALHHLSINGPNPRIGYFDTNRDINNLMFRTYQENPFRFLSLYHGFDMSSLERDAAGGGTAVAAGSRFG